MAFDLSTAIPVRGGFDLSTAKPVDSGQPAKFNWRSFAAEEAKRQGVDPNLITKMIETESSGNGAAVSGKGAKGYMQLMPGTAAEMGVTDINDPMQNISAGIRYFKQQLGKFGSPELALAAYNAGPGAVEKYGNRVPPFRETIAYVKKITGGNPGVASVDYSGEPEILPDFSAGLVRGAGSIGSTLLAPYDMAKDAIAGKGLSLESNRQRRKDIDSGLQDLTGADPDSLLYGAGKLTSEVAGTWPLSGVLASLVSRAPGVSNALADAIASGGFSVSGEKGARAIINRLIGGAISGGASAGAIDPSMAPAGAAIGGGLPVIGAGIAGASQAVGNALRPSSSKQAERLAEYFGMTVDELRSKIANYASDHVPGYKATVPQLLMTPEASQLGRTIKTANGNALFNAEQAQQKAYMDAIESIAPTYSGMQEASEAVGSAIEQTARPAHAQARDAAGRAFQSSAIDPSDSVRIKVPLDQFDQAIGTYLGPGTFGTGSKAKAAIDEARRLSSAEAGKKVIGPSGLLEDLPVQGKAIGFRELQNLRSSIGEAADAAAKYGPTKESAALAQMKREIDARIESAVNGDLLPEEIFPAEVAERYSSALAGWAAMKNRFERGPQKSMFRMGGDGEPVAQGAEIPRLFYNAKRSQAEDIQAFKRLVNNDAELVKALKQYAMTEASSKASSTGNLGEKFVKWAVGQSGANRELLSAGEMAKINEVAKLVRRGIKAENIGRVSGSDTAQKAYGLLSSGMLDSKIAELVSKKVPGGRYVIDALSDSVSNHKRNALAGLLANPDELSNALISPRLSSDWLRKSGLVLDRIPVITSSLNNP